MRGSRDGAQTSRGWDIFQAEPESCRQHDSKKGKQEHVAGRPGGLPCASQRTARARSGIPPVSWLQHVWRFPAQVHWADSRLASCA